MRYSSVYEERKECPVCGERLTSPRQLRLRTVYRWLGCPEDHTHFKFPNDDVGYWSDEQMEAEWKKKVDADIAKEHEMNLGNIRSLGRWDLKSKAERATKKAQKQADRQAKKNQKLADKKAREEAREAGKEERRLVRLAAENARVEREESWLESCRLTFTKEDQFYVDMGVTNHDLANMFNELDRNSFHKMDCERKRISKDRFHLKQVQAVWDACVGLYRRVEWMKRQAIEAGAARYNETTGNFEWIEKESS